MKYNLEITYQFCLIVIISCVPFIFTLNGDFVFDDSEAITKNKDVTSDSFIQAFKSDFWGTDIKSNLSHKSYRPLTVITFRLNYLFSGRVLIPYHFKVTNLICHTICCILVWRSYNAMLISSKYVIKSKSSLVRFLSIDFLAAIIFAVHPVHTEAICGIVGRADVLAAITYLTSFLFYHHAVINDIPSFQPIKKWCYLLLSVILAPVSMLFKESGITVLGFCFGYELILNTCLIRSREVNIVSNKSNRLVRLVVLFTSAVCILYLRWLIMGNSMPHFTSLDNPAAFRENLFTKYMTYSYIHLMNFVLLIWPYWLCYDWSMGCIPLIEEIQDYRTLLTFLFQYNFFFFLFLVVYHTGINSNKRRLLLMAISMMVIPFIPASNIFVTVGFVIAERILYIPSAGFCLLIAIGCNSLLRKHKVKGLFIFTLIDLLLCYATKSSLRSFQWQNEYDLFTSALSICPDNAKVHYNVAKVADARNQIDWSLFEYKEAIRLHPQYYQAMNNLGNLLKNQKKYDDAEKYFKMALSHKKQFPAAWMNLGIVLASINRYNESEKAYLTAIDYRAKYPDCYYNLGNLYLHMKQYDRAEVAWSKAIALNSKHKLAWTNLLATLDNTGQTSKALNVIQTALNELPEEPSIHFVIANIYGKRSQFEESERHFKENIRLLGDKVQAFHYSNFGVLYHRWKKYKLAEEYYKKALKLNPNFESALKNLKVVQKLLDNNNNV